MATLEERIFNLTGSFEGSRKYATLSGNGDGMGVSWGIFQWNLGMGTLQQLLLKMYKAGPATFERCCAVTVQGKPMNLTGELMKVCQMARQDAVKWAAERMDPTGRRFAAHYGHWVLVFDNLAKEPGFQAIQRQMGSAYYLDALQDAKFYGIATERGIALTADISVQSGQGKVGRIARPDAKLAFEKKGGMALPYKDRMIALAEANAMTCRRDPKHKNPDWIREDALARKLAIACGCGKRHEVHTPDGDGLIAIQVCGVVHGKRWDIARDFGITDAPVRIG